MYYVIEMDESADVNVYMEPLNNVHARLQNGDRINVDERKLELPFRFEMKVRKNRDGSRQQPRFNTYDSSKELMHTSLVEALQSAGVDNLQIFPAIVTEAGAEEENKDFVVVNVVGLASSASADSETHQLLMFRLAESKLNLIIHERIAENLIHRNFPYLNITPINEG